MFIYKLIILGFPHRIEIAFFSFSFSISFYVCICAPVFLMTYNLFLFIAYVKGLPGSASPLSWVIPGSQYSTLTFVISIVKVSFQLGVQIKLLLLLLLEVF